MQGGIDIKKLLLKYSGFILEKTGLIKSLRDKKDVSGVIRWYFHYSSDDKSFSVSTVLFKF